VKLDSNAYMVTYTVIMGVVVSLLLTGAGEFANPRRRANEEAEKLLNVMSALGVPFDAKAGAAQLKALFAREVREVQTPAGVRYLYQPQGVDRPKAVAVPFEGPGLWGPIKGFLALEPDERTVRGLTVYQQEETPGLGGEIASADFCDRFVGKRIRVDGTPGLWIRPPGTAAASNEVDGITGATMTCRKVEAMINTAIANIEPTEASP
jgi:Na+-transporting NADH:ubiquinone oxidoreductase subunit C